MVYVFREAYMTHTSPGSGQHRFGFSHRLRISSLPSREAAEEEARAMLKISPCPGIFVSEKGVEVDLSGGPEWDNFLGPQSVMQLMCGDVLEGAGVFLVRRSIM